MTNKKTQITWLSQSRDGYTITVYANECDSPKNMKELVITRSMDDGTPLGELKLYLTRETVAMLGAACENTLTMWED